jgi:hypothetical protein
MNKLKSRFETLVAQYGGVAIGLWFALFFTTWFACWVGVKAGLWPDSWVPESGRPEEGFLRAVVFKMGPQVFVAYLMTQLTKPIRFLAVLTATPVVARWVGREPEAIASEEEDGAPSEAPGA